MFREFDQRKMSHTDHAFARITIQRAKREQLFEEDIFQSCFLLEFAARGPTIDWEEDQTKKVVGTQLTKLATCAKGKAGRACKKACRLEKRTDTTACKHASNPTPPGCGEASPSGAFLG